MSVIGMLHIERLSKNAPCAPRTGLLGLLCGCFLPTCAHAINPDSKQLFEQGQRYERASHTTAEFRRAYWAYCLAGRNGHAEAAYNIAWMYLNGRGVPRDDQLAGHWLDVSARLGDPHSMHLADRLVLDAADDDPNCPRALGRQRIDMVEYGQRLARFNDTQTSPFQLRQVTRPPAPDPRHLAQNDADSGPSDSPPARSASVETSPADTTTQVAGTPRPERVEAQIQTALPPVEDRSPPNRAPSSIRPPPALSEAPTPDRPSLENGQASRSASTLPTAPSREPDSSKTQRAQAHAADEPRSTTLPEQVATSEEGCPWTLAATHGKYRQRVITWLIDNNISHRIESGRDRVNDYFVVMIHPHGSPDAARDTAASLRSRGYDKLRIFRSGDYANAVSLGIFRKQSGAEALRDKLLDAGFQAINKRMRYPPSIPLIRARLDPAQRAALGSAFPPLPMKQLDCDQLTGAARDQGSAEQSTG